MLIENWKNDFRFQIRQPVFEFIWFSSRKLHKNYQMSDEIKSYICLVFSVYKSFHQTVKYGHQRNHILQDLTFLWRIVRPKTGLKPVFNNQKPVCQKNCINIPSSYSQSLDCATTVNVQFYCVGYWGREFLCLGFCAVCMCSFSSGSGIML